MNAIILSSHTEIVDPWFDAGPVRHNYSSTVISSTLAVWLVEIPNQISLLLPCICVYLKSISLSFVLNCITVSKDRDSGFVKLYKESTR